MSGKIFKTEEEKMNENLDFFIKLAKDSNDPYLLSLISDSCYNLKNNTEGFQIAKRIN